MLPANALRLSALVAAAMTSGYLWRAAVESHEPAEVLRSPPPAIGFELPDVPFSSLDRLRVLLPPSAPVGERRTVARRKPRLSISSRRPGAAQLISAVEAPPTSSSPAGRAKHQSRPRAAEPRSKAPAKKRRPKPPAPPAAPTPPPPPPPPVSPPESPPAPPAGIETRPGWGKGDKNHTHTGPPGQKKEKKRKK